MMDDKSITREDALNAINRIWDRCEEIEAHLPEGDPDKTGYKMIADYLTVWKYLFAQPERKTGRWEKAENDGNDGKSKEWIPWLCSECGYRVDRSRTRFCPNCGSLMLKEGEG